MYEEKKKKSLLKFPAHTHLKIALSLSPLFKSIFTTATSKFPKAAAAAAAVPAEVIVVNKVQGFSWPQTLKLACTAAAAGDNYFLLLP